jgi:hypothetical protein
MGGISTLGQQVDPECASPNPVRLKPQRRKYFGVTTSYA